MPKKSLRCNVEIEIHAITSPGTWLAKRDDLYATIRLFGQTRRTRYISAVFPLVFHEKFKFDKVFYSAFEPAQVADSLEDCTIRIELVQISGHYQDGRLLAWFEGSARDFLYPYPSYNLSYGTHDRELLLERTLSFPGISPRLEFSTKTIIQQTISPGLELFNADDEVAGYNATRNSLTSSSGRQSRSRTRARTPSPARSSRGAYGRPTISSISRSRSVSPALYNRTSELCLDDTETATNVEDRPPFVVRKVTHNLIGRKPGTVYKRSLSADRKPTRSTSPALHRSYTNYATPSSNYLEKYERSALSTSRPYSTSVSTPSTRRPYSSYTSYGWDGYTDLDRDLLESAYYRRLRAEALSPTRYRSTYRDYVDDRPWSPTYAEIIRERVKRALRRDRSLEELERLRSYRPHVLPYDTLNDLELDFELARRRRYYL